LNTDLIAAVVAFGVVLISLTIHEAAHALTADRLGDPTARALGRVSLNPLVHIDWIGTVLLPIIAAISHFPIIGWAKPVPVNMRNLKDPRRDFMIVAAAGPISNLVQAVVAAILLRVVGAALPEGVPGWVIGVLTLAVEINLLLAFFNQCRRLTEATCCWVCCRREPRRCTLKCGNTDSSCCTRCSSPASRAD